MFGYAVSGNTDASVLGEEQDFIFWFFRVSANELSELMQFLLIFSSAVYFCLQHGHHLGGHLGGAERPDEDYFHLCLLLSYDSKFSATTQKKKILCLTRVEPPASKVLALTDFRDQKLVGRSSKSYARFAVHPPVYPRSTASWTQVQGL